MLVLLQAVTTGANHAPLFSAQGFTDAGLCAAGGVAISTPYHNALGMHLKAHAVIRNAWVPDLLVVLAVVVFGAVVVAGVRLGYDINPLTMLGAAVGWHGGAMIAPPVYKAAQPGNAIASIPVVGPLISSVLTPGTNDPYARPPPPAPPPPPHP